MKKTIFIFLVIILVIGGMVTWYFYGKVEFNLQEILMLAGVLLVVAFAFVIGVRRIQSLKKSQPPEDELSKGILKRASGTAYHLSLYTWLALMFLSDETKMELQSYIGIGIMLMAVEFALAWVYHNYFVKVK